MIVVAIIAVTVSTDKVYAFSIGETGESVKDLQITLIEAGYDIPAITSGGASFGYFGVQTKAALARYEADNETKGIILGANPGTDFPKAVSFLGGVTYSNTFATTSVGAGTLTAGSIANVTSILSTNSGALTLTMPASTTLRAFIPKAGDAKRVILVNQGTALLTLAGGTGTLLQTASSTKTVNIGGSALLNFVRKSNSDIIVLMSPGI